MICAIAYVSEESTNDRQLKTQMSLQVSMCN
jgi:hypothetical protein